MVVVQPERWRVHPLAALHWRLIDGEWLLYEDSTGATHMIDHLGTAVLTCFESCADLSMDELIARLADDLALVLSPDQAGSVVRQCSALGLLLPLSSASPPALHAAA